MLFRSGLGGVVLYILARLRTIEMEKTESPFDDKYLHSLYLRLKEIISQIDIYSDSIDIFLSFIHDSFVLQIYCITIPYYLPESILPHPLHSCKYI